MFARRSTHLILAAWLVLAAWAVACTGVGSAATSGTVVAASVPSATSINTGACAPGTANVTDFSGLTVSSSNVTSSNCVITFGSSNDVARLRMAQADQHGSAMYRTTTGAPDTTFSGDGVATWSSSTGDEVLGSVAVQADGKVVAAGYYDDAGTIRAMVMRLTAAGVLDPTFAGDGVREFTAVDAGTWSSPQVAVDPSGRIVVAWLSSTPVGTLRLARLDPTGADDGTFGTAGMASHALSGGGNSGWILDVAVDDAGRILVAGRVWPMVEWTWTGIIARYGPTGAIDTTLGGDGVILARCPTATYGEMVTDILALPGGGFLTANDQQDGPYDRQIAQWLPNGSLDPAFGTGGCTKLTGSGGAGLVRDPTGRILVGVGTGVRRMSAAGVVDSAFGASGVASVGATVRDVAVDVDGTIIASSITSAFRTTRLTDAGAIVATHGTGGTATITVGGDAAQGNPNDMVLAPDGHVVQVGRDTSDGTAVDSVVIRTEASKVANYGAGQDWIAGGTNGVFGACLRDATNGAVSDGTTWTSNLGVACPATNGAIWKGIPETTADPAALVARTTTANTTTATATLQFGFRTAAAQPSGTYLAPVTFEVVAP